MSDEIEGSAGIRFVVDPTIENPKAKLYWMPFPTETPWYAMVDGQWHMVFPWQAAICLEWGYPIRLGNPSND